MQLYNMLIASDFEGLPSLEEFKLHLEDLKNIKLVDPTIDEIHKTYFSILPFLPRMLSRINFDENRELPFYRVRLNIDPQKEDLSLIRTYSYPSADHCKTSGRANRRGKTVFYCSNKAFAAIFESKPKVGDIGYLSIWENDITRPLNAAVYLPKKFNNPNEWETVANSAHKFADSYFEINGKDKVEHFKELKNFISDRFVTENYPYALTSFVSDEALFGKDAKDLVLYPSVASNSHYCNFAIHPNIVERYLTFKKVIRFKVLGINSNLELSLSTGRIGEVIQNNIVWRDATFEEIDFENLP